MQPLSRSKQLFLGQLLNFWAEASNQKRKKVFFFYFLLNENKLEFIANSEMKYPQSGFLLILGGVSRSKQF